MKQKRKKMKQLKLTLTLSLIFTVAIIGIICGCSSTYKPIPKDEKFKIDALENGGISVTYSGDDNYIFDLSEGDDSYIYVFGKEKLGPPILITPNPTSSSITITFFNKDERLFPQNITVELYYLDMKVHTFEFNNSNGVEVIPESYLTKEGMYRVVADMSIKEAVAGGYNSRYVAAFMVMKK